jgi:hypothetical protein
VIGLINLINLYYIFLKNSICYNKSTQNVPGINLHSHTGSCVAKLPVVKYLRIHTTSVKRSNPDSHINYLKLAMEKNPIGER